MAKLLFNHHLFRANPTKHLFQANIQKESYSSLTDTFGRKHDYLRISVTERCNLRCLYCMPEDGVQLTPKSKLLSNDEIYRLSRLFVTNLGVQKIRLTGGEPLIRSDIVELVENIAKLKCDNSGHNGGGLKALSMTTNGIVFYRFSKSLRQAGLDSVNISLDTLRKDRFEKMTRRNGLDKTLKSIHAALSDNYDSVKVNCVPINGVNDDEIEDFVNLTKDLKIEIRFIEYMPFDGNGWHFQRIVPYKHILKRLQSKFQMNQLPPANANQTARLFRVDGFRGTIGFINSMTQPFCSGCNRIRLTADGHLKVCLFGKEEVSLKEALINGDDDDSIINMIQSAVKRKKQQHAGAENIAKYNSAHRPMVLIDQRRYKTSCSDGQLTHVDCNDGQVNMVDVGHKPHSLRTASAQARVFVGEQVMRQIQHNQIAKGNVLTVAKTAAINAAKMTHHLIPLCHQIPLDQVEVTFQFDEEQQDIIIETVCRATWKTGVEMEALLSASVAALTIYDMCKAANKQIVIKHCHLLYKTGGKSNFQFKH